MKYKGKELVEMTPEKWDGKTRDMLVWDTEKYAPVINTIVGYTTNGQWLNTIGDESNHCAEIPNQEYNIDKMIKVLNAYKEGKKLKVEKKLHHGVHGIVYQPRLGILTSMNIV